MTVGLCELDAVTPSGDLWLRINTADSNDIPVVLSTSDLWYKPLGLSAGTVSKCNVAIEENGVWGSWSSTFSVGVTLTAGDKYALTMGGTTTTREYRWTEGVDYDWPTTWPQADPGYVVGYMRFSSGTWGGNGWFANAVWMEFTCA